VTRPVWVDTWFVILVVWTLCGAWLLSTNVGQQALIDERVRVIETLGGTVSDQAYAALRATPPWWVYPTSGGRLLLTPIMTLLAAVAVTLAARADGTRATIWQGLAVAVHASVPLLIGQLIATPLHFVRESLTSPLNLATFLPLMDSGTLPALFFGTMDFFVLWWAGLLALGVAALTGRRARRYAWPLVAVYLGFAGVVAAVIAVVGGA